MPDEPEGDLDDEESPRARLAALKLELQSLADDVPESAYDTLSAVYEPTFHWIGSLAELQTAACGYASALRAAFRGGKYLSSEDSPASDAAAPPGVRDGSPLSDTELAACVAWLDEEL